MKLTIFCHTMFFKSFVSTSLILILVLSSTGCKKFIQVDAPVDKIVGNFAFSNNENAIAVVTGIYYDLSKSNEVFSLLGVSADEFKLYQDPTGQYLSAYTNALNSNIKYAPWNFLYNIIFKANGAIEGIMTSNSLNMEVRKQLLGECKFNRAFCYFYLINLYGGVPLILSTDYKTNQYAGRESTEEIYKQIIKDLVDAEEELSGDFLEKDLLTHSADRIRPTKTAAAALLARVYLYTEDWQKAKEKATETIGKSNMFELLTDINNVFLSNNKEAIWQIAPVLNGYNQTQEARFFILNSSPNFENPVSLSDFVYDNFEPGDKRKTHWVGTYTDDSVIPNRDYHYPFKYKIKDNTLPASESTVVLRLAEQFLIRAEAKARLGELSGGQGAASDLNVIRVRAGLHEIFPETMSEMLLSIEKERQLELFSEWGHRWLDLKRTNRANTVMSGIMDVKGGTWSPNDQLYPIPLEDMLRDPNLRPQNTGY